MTNDRQELIQRYIDGQATLEETAALEEAMKQDADLCALYLDYMNLDVALGATAEAAALAEPGIGARTIAPRRLARSSAHRWRWLAAAAASAALVVIAVWVKHHSPSQESLDVATACAPTQAAIARLSIEPPASFPAWVSPTASMLDQPRIPLEDL
jgi:hypothetical protein